MPKQPALKAETLNLNDKEPSFLFALRELIQTDGLNFDEWWDEFKKGFVLGKRDPKTNFKLKEWIKPKYVDMTPADSKSGAMTIEYWPDNDKLDTSYLLSGTTGAIIKSFFSCY